MATKTIWVRAHKDPFHVADAEQTLRENLIGDNVGNLVFSQSVFKLLTRDDTRVERLERALPGRVNREADALVLPFANAFRSGFAQQLDLWADRIATMKVPVVVLGVGAQATLDGQTKVHAGIEDSVRRFVAAVLDHSAKIGVRGEFTRDYLARLGFGDEHVEVIGCPSMYMYGPQLPTPRPLPEITADSPLAFNLSPYRKRMGAMSIVNAREYPNLTYFAQDHRALGLLLDGVYEGRVLTKKLPVRLGHPLIRQDRVVFCLDPATWFAELARRDFSFGTRIHGNIAAILAGTPALVLAHDSRTLELVEYHRIPHVALDAVDQRARAAELAEQVDTAPMVAAHRENWERFTAFLAANDLRHAFEPGQDPDAFDRRIAQVDYPPPVRTLMGARPSELYAMKRELDTLRAQRRGLFGRRVNR